MQLLDQGGIYLKLTHLADIDTVHLLFCIDYLTLLSVFGMRLSMTFLDIEKVVGLHEGGPRKTHNYLLEGGPLVVQASPTKVSVSGTLLYQCTSWCCERLCLTSVILSVHLPIS